MSSLLFYKMTLNPYTSIFNIDLKIHISISMNLHLYTLSTLLDISIYMRYFEIF